MRLMINVIIIFSISLTSFSQICTNPFLTIPSVYVDPDNLCGVCDDSNDGTISQPVCSILYGLRNLVPGGKLFLREGIHRIKEELSVYANVGPYFIFNGHSPDNKTEIRNYPGENPKIYLSAKVINWVQHSGSIYKVDWMPYVTKTNVRHAPQMVVINDNPENPTILQQVNSALFTTCGTWLSSVRTGVGDMIAGDFFYDIQGTKSLYIWLPDGSDPNLHDIEAGFVRFFRINSMENVKISGLEFRYSGAENLQCGWASTIFGGINIEISYNKFLYSDAICLSGGGKHAIAKNNLFLYCGNSGSAFKGNMTIFEENEIAYSNWRGYSVGWHSGGMKLIPAVSNMIVRRNLVYLNTGAGIWFDTMGNNNTIEENISFNNTKDGIHFEISTGIPEKNLYNHLRGNLIIGNRRGIYVAGSSGTKVYHNTMIHNQEQMTVHGHRKGFNITFNYLYNNIAIDSASATQGLGIGFHAQLYVGILGHNNSFNTNLYDTIGYFSYGIGYYHRMTFKKWSETYKQDLDFGYKQPADSFVGKHYQSNSFLMTKKHSPIVNQY